MLTQMETAYLNACNECAAACLQCATLCLNEDDPKAMVSCILLDMECADMCRHTAQAIARNDSHLHAISFYVAKFAKNVLRNVANMLWTIVSIVLSLANAVRLPVAA